MGEERVKDRWSIYGFVFSAVCFVAMLLVFFIVKENEIASSIKRYNIVKKQYKWLDKDLYNLVCKESDRNNLDYRLILALIQAESSGKRMAISHAGAKGYMQIMDFHYKGNSLDLFKTDINIKLGTKIFKYYLKKAKGNIVVALRYYERGIYGKGRNDRYIVKILTNFHKAEERY